MRSVLGAVALAALPAALFAASPTPQVPQGLLPDTAQPLAYRLDLTVLPEQERFSGHAEIDITLKAPAESLYLHGRDLNVTTAVAQAGGRSVHATYSQVDPLGVARLDFATAQPAGRTTLVFDYDAPFGSAPSGLHHARG